MTPAALIALDVDNTLMPVDGPAEEGVREGLLELAAAGARLVIASGKPCYYLAGLVRGLGLMDSSLIGENGAEVWLNCTFPPDLLPTPITDEERAALAQVRGLVSERFGDRVAFEPGTVAVTPFPTDPSLTPEAIREAMDIPLPPTVQVYMHPDSVDWGVSRIDKGVAVARLAERFGAPLSRVAAVGDGENDRPMLAIAELALWLGPDPAPASAVRLGRIREALPLLREFVRRSAGSLPAAPG